MSDFIRKHKEEYKRLKSCYCPILNKVIYFNFMGFDHLLHKNKRPRSIKEIYSRLHLLKYVKTVILKSNYVGYRRIKTLVQCKLEHRIGDTIIKVIAQKKGEGSYIFLSIMRKRIRNKKTQN
jgi:hypothetical protein